MSGFLSVCAGLLIGHRKLILQLSRMYEQWIIKMFCGIVWKIISFYFIASEFQCYDSATEYVYVGFSRQMEDQRRNVISICLLLRLQYIYIKSCVSLGGLYTWYIIMFSISCLWSRLVFVKNPIEDNQHCKNT